jgi:adenylate cyclase
VSDPENGVASSNAFEAELRRQILASEKERAGLQVLMGLGIFVTIAVVSVVGSAARREYTIIGDVVNVAFRIEQLNKELNSHFLASESVRESAASFEAGESAASVPIRGRNASVRVYKLE